MRSEGHERPPLAVAVERSERSRRRVELVFDSLARRQLRHRMLLVCGWVLGTVVSLRLGMLVAGIRGSLLAVGVLVLTGVIHHAAVRAARRRGAVAWDWRAARYRLAGNPADDVQKLDRYVAVGRDALGQTRYSDAGRVAS